MTSLRATNRNNPCQVCGDITGKCRHNNETGDYLCMINAEAKKFEIINGYKCIAHTKDNMWAIFTEHVENHRYSPNFKKARIETKPKENDNLKISTLSELEKHDQYSKLLDELSLHPLDHADLKRRGFTDDEIKLNNFKSVSKYQMLTGSYSFELPGLNNSNQINVKGDGYLCPIRNYDGLLVGFQIRLRNSEQGRYRWLSGQVSPHLEVNGKNELPLAVFKPSTNPIGIAIVEGVGTKAFYTSQRLNYLVIGAAGGQHTGSPEQLKNYIQKAVDEYGNLPITIFPDHNWALDNNVKNRLLATIDFLKSNSSQQILIGDWNQLTKNQPDIDEISTGFGIRYLSVEAFCKKYKEVLKDSKVFQNWASSRKLLTADILKNEKWLSIPENITEQCDILIIRKGLGGGKTQGLIEFLRKITENIPTFLIGYRNSLIHQTIARSNNAGLSAIHVRDLSETIAGTTVNFGFDESIRLYGACADSFNKLDSVMTVKDQYFVAIDEIVSVLRHLKSGGTLKKRQQEAINWVLTAIDNSTFTILMDANVCDSDVELMRKLLPSKRIKILDSIHKPKLRKFFFLEVCKDANEYSSNSKYLPANLVAIAQKNNKVLWLSDSQKSCEVADELSTKNKFKTFRLDGKTSGEDISKLFLQNPDDFITSEGIDRVLLSPSAESGLSINLEGYFDAVCVDIRGVLDVNSLLQIMARLRDCNVPIYVSCPEFVNFEENKQPYKWEYEFNRAVNERLKVFESKIDDSFYGSDEEYKKIFDDVIKDIKKRFETDHLFLSSLKDNQKDIYEKSNLRIALKTALSQDDHIVIDYLEISDTATHEDVKSAKDSVIRRQSEKEFNSVDIEVDKAEQLSRQSDNSYDVQCQIKKALLRRDLPGIEHTDSWNSELFYILNKNPKFLSARWRFKQLQKQELSIATFKLQNKDKVNDLLFNTSDVWFNRSIKIDAFRKLGLLEFIDAESFSNVKDSEHLSTFELVDQYYKDDKHFHLIGIKKIERNRSHVATMFKKFISYFGLEVKQVAKIDGEKLYKCVVPEELQPFIKDIDDCLDRRAEKIINDAKDVAITESNLKNKAIESEVNSFEQEVKTLENTIKIQKLANQYNEDNETLSPVLADLTDVEIQALLNVVSNKILKDF